jgi:uncharacterized membrane protein
MATKLSFLDRLSYHYILIPRARHALLDQNSAIVDSTLRLHRQDAMDRRSPNRRMRSGATALQSLPPLLQWLRFESGSHDRNLSGAQRRNSAARCRIATSLLHLAVWDIFRRSRTSNEEVTTVKKVVIALVLVLSVFTLTAIAGEWTGYISDSKCGAKGDNDSHADCAVKCVKGGRRRYS